MVIFAAKLATYILSGSRYLWSALGVCSQVTPKAGITLFPPVRSAMLAETVHSVVDTFIQVHG